MISNKKLKMGDTYIKFYQQIPVKKLRITPEVYKTIWDLHPLEYPKIKMFKKEINTPRWFQNYGHVYNFSNINHSALSIPEILQPYLDYVNMREPDYDFNGILLNWYQDGSHYIGRHSDNEKELVKGAPVYCFSFGQERRFIIDRLPEEKYEYTLPNNSLIIMGGECQKYYKHHIPKTKKECTSRISFTIRAFF